MNRPDETPNEDGQEFAFVQMDFGLGTPSGITSSGEGTGRNDGGEERDTLEEWRSERRAQLERLALAQGLPLGNRVTVELRGGRFIEGKLLLGGDMSGNTVRADTLLDLRIGHARFHAAEIVSCVRLD